MRYGSILAVAFLVAAATFAQRVWMEHPEAPKPVFAAEAEFHFVRLEYTDLPQFHRRFGFASRGANGSGWWMMDWPDADEHFTTGIGRLTRVHAGEPEHYGLMDDRIFDHPWMYATQTGWWNLSAPETARLREYLLRGGFLVVDDFWGPDQWQIFEETMNRVFPGQPIPDIDEKDSVMHVVYDIREKDRTFIPGTRHLRMSGGKATVQQPPGMEPTWRAIYDPKGRMVVAVNFNTDVGDAWEWADAPEYPAEMTGLAYRYGVNYLVYAMSH